MAGRGWRSSTSPARECSPATARSRNTPAKSGKQNRARSSEPSRRKQRPPLTRRALPMPQASTSPGRSYPLGASWTGDGVNFSVFAKYSTGAQLLLFDDIDAPAPSRTVDLDPQVNRSYHYWHVFVPGIGPGQVYGYRIGGPFDPRNGLRFDRDKL